MRSDLLLARSSWATPRTPVGVRVRRNPILAFARCGRSSGARCILHVGQITSSSAVDGAHLLLGVALAGGRSSGHGLLYTPQVLVGKRDVRCTSVLLEVLAALGAGDGDYIVPLAQEPREGELSRCGVLLGGDLPDPVRQLHVPPEVLLREAREAGAPCVVLGQVLDAPPGAGQETTSQRAVGDEADPEVADGRQDLILRIPGEERVLALEGAHRVHRMRPPDGLGPCLGEPQVSYLPRLDELLHSPHRLLDGHLRVDPVLVVEVYRVHAEPFERGVARPLYVLRLAVDADPASVLATLVAELGGEDDLVAPALDGFADEPLVGERAVHVRRVEEVDTELHGAVDRGDRLSFVRGAVELAHPHAPES